MSSLPSNFPVTLRCHEEFDATVDRLFSTLVSVEGMKCFVGSAMVPGITGVDLPDGRFPGPGERMRVHSSDGTSYVEEVAALDPPRLYHIRLLEFEGRIALFAPWAEEWFTFTSTSNGSRLDRVFTFYAHSEIAQRAVSVPLNLFMPRALENHHRKLKELLAR